MYGVLYLKNNNIVSAIFVAVRNDYALSLYLKLFFLSLPYSSHNTTMCQIDVEIMADYGIVWNCSKQKSKQSDTLHCGHS